MNTQKIIVGGLTAGLVMNVVDFISNGVVLKSMNDADLKRIGINSEALMTGGTIALFVVLDFIAGLIVTWLYAAIRPRFGAAPKTALFAGLAMWVIGGWVWTMIFAMGVFPWSSYPAGAIAALVSILAGAYTGGALYKEDAAA